MKENIKKIMLLIFIVISTAVIAQEEGEEWWKEYDGRYIQNRYVSGYFVRPGERKERPENALYAGTVFSAVMISAVNSESAGPLQARVIDNIYDTKTKKVLLIPKGTVLQGNFSSASVSGDKIQIAWESMVVSYMGISYQLSLGEIAGADKRGRSAEPGFIDDHYLEWLKAAGVVTLYSEIKREDLRVIMERTNEQILKEVKVDKKMLEALGERLVERATDVPQLLRMQGGRQITVKVNADIELRPYEDFRSGQRYVRRN